MQGGKGGWLPTYWGVKQGCWGRGMGQWQEYWGSRGRVQGARRVPWYGRGPQGRARRAWHGDTVPCGGDERGCVSVEWATLV